MGNGLKDLGIIREERSSLEMPSEADPIDISNFDFSSLNIDPAGFENFNPNIATGGGLPSNSEVNKAIQYNVPPPPPPPTVSSLPSLPSISNVGSVPFSGSVNWNAVPAGFQPLPQTLGGRKKLYQLSQFHGGINQKSSPRDISEIECQEATNVTFSKIGSITLLGDIKSEDNSIDSSAVDTTDRGAAGYGLFQFTAPAQLGGTVGETVVTLSPDGDRIDYVDASGNGAFIDYASTDDHDVAHVIYAAGNGVYANDANFRSSSDNLRKAKIYVYREDAGSSQTVSGWKEGKPLIDSPTYDSDADGDMVAGTVKCTHDGGTASASGSMIVECDPNGTGNWNGTYDFYVSWLFDGGVETGLTSFGTDDGDDANSNGIAFSNNKLELNISLKHTPHASNNTELGADKRIEGARIYFNTSGNNERYLLAELNLKDGVKGALDSTFTPWTESSDVYSHDMIIFESPPEVYTYVSLNGYYANEAYGESKTELASTTAGPVAHDVRYKSAVVGQQGVVFIGNVKFMGKHMPDTMMYSMPNKPGLFPKFNYFDSPSSDGSPITALAAFQDTILQFKKDAMYVINISKPSQFYAEASFRFCGVHNPCQVFTTPFGIIFANKHGCFIYDGSKVVSLTGGKFSDADWDLPEDEGSSIGVDGAGVPCVGYDPRSQNIIVLKDINHTSTTTTAWVYNMLTQSWTEGTSMVVNANGNRHTNFIVSSGGYLSILRDDSATIFNYNQGQASGNAQTVTYITKDIDFGAPTQTKKIFKIYVTYQGACTSLAGTYGADGDSTPDTAMTNAETSDATLDNAGVTDHNVATFTLNSHPSNLKSIAFKFTGSVGEDFEINDISILYRLRPIK